MKIGNDSIRRVNGVRFLGVWVDEGLKWATQIENVRARVSRLVGVLGRAGTVVGGHSLLMLYNALVLPHLQYCLMVWGDFHEGRNSTLGESLLRLQKRLAGIIVGRNGRYHSDPYFAQLGILKIGDLYRQQLRIHAWKFQNQKLPENQASMLTKTSDVHGYNTRSARTGLYLQTQDHRSVGYRVPREWATVSNALNDKGSLSSFKKKIQRGICK